MEKKQTFLNVFPSRPFAEYLREFPFQRLRRLHRHCPRSIAFSEHFTLYLSPFSLFFFFFARLLFSFGVKFRTKGTMKSAKEHQTQMHKSVDPRLGFLKEFLGFRKCSLVLQSSSSPTIRVQIKTTTKLFSTHTLAVSLSNTIRIKLTTTRFHAASVSNSISPSPRDEIR